MLRDSVSIFQIHLQVFILPSITPTQKHLEEIVQLSSIMFCIFNAWRQSKCKQRDKSTREDALNGRNRIDFCNNSTCQILERSMKLHFFCVSYAFTYHVHLMTKHSQVSNLLKKQAKYIVSAILTFTSNVTGFTWMSIIFTFQTNWTCTLAPYLSTAIFTRLPVRK